VINRIFGSLFMGLIFVSILDFLYFIGLKLNYFDLYKIDVYFNTLFVDNQNFYLLIPLSLVLGYLLMHSPFTKVFMKIYIVTILLFTTIVYEPIGKTLGELVFLKKDQHYKLGSTTFSGATLYEGRKSIYIYRKDVSKTIKLPIHEVKNITISS